MQLSQQELEQIDLEIQPLRNEKGLLPTSKIWSWLAMKGAVRINENNVPLVIYKYEGPRILFEVYRDKFEIYEKWRKNGKKLDNIGNFGIKNDNPSKKPANKIPAKARDNIQDDFEKDVPF